jgi:nucleoside-diphosphate-sugar epimerase
MKVLVTGAGGFIGLNLLERLTQAGGETVATVRPGTARGRIARFAGVIVEETDLLDAPRLQAIFRKHRPQTVYHLASTGWNERVAPDVHRRTIENGMANLLAAAGAAGASRLIVTGSAAEYGSGAAFTEESALAPETVLGKSKAAALSLAVSEAVRSGIELVWLRLFTPFGPWEHPKRLVPSVIQAALSRRQVRLRAPRQSRDFLAVQDVVGALWAANHRPLPNPAIVNICRGTPVEAGEMARKILQLAGEDPALAVEAPESLCAETIHESSGSNGRAKAWLDWEPAVSLESGIVRSIQWWKEQQVQ